MLDNCSLIGAVETIEEIETREPSETTEKVVFYLADTG
jgi:hypothetical protein